MSELDSELDSEEEKILAGARRAFAPSEDDAARVLRATSLALGLPVTGLPPAANGSRAALGSAAKLSPLTAAVGKWLGAALVVGAAAGGGYVYGFRAGREASRDVVAIAAPAPAVARTAAAIADHAVESLPPSAASAAVADPVEPTPGPITPAPAKPANAASSARTPSLQAELRALRRVESALRYRQAEVALQLLARLDRDIPRGQSQLLEERAAAWALARCGKSRSSEVARDFAEKNPASVYAERVLAACDGPAADSFGNRTRQP